MTFGCPFVCFPTTKASVNQMGMPTAKNKCQDSVLGLGWFRQGSAQRRQARCMSIDFGLKGKLDVCAARSAKGNGYF